MTAFTFEETTLMTIYTPGTRTGLMDELSKMRTYLEPDETELLELTDSVLRKLEGMSDAEFTTLDLTPDFEGMEDTDAPNQI